MIAGAERFLYVLGAILADHLKAFGQSWFLAFPQPVEALLQCFGDGFRQAFTRKFDQCLGQTVCLFVLDIHSHDPPFYPCTVLFYHSDCGN